MASVAQDAKVETTPATSAAVSRTDSAESSLDSMGSAPPPRSVRADTPIDAAIAAAEREARTAEALAEGRRRQLAGVVAALVSRFDVAAPDPDQAEGLKPGGVPQAEPRPQLPHLNGLKALACFWVVISHFSQRPRGLLEGLFDRGFVPVCFFVVLSGFLTHYSYLNKPLATTRQVLQFHANRLGRILPLHWAILVWCLLCQVFWHTLPWRLFPQMFWGAFFLVTSWYCYNAGETLEPASAVFSTHQCEYHPLNELHWTLSTLLFAWLLYPPLRPLFFAGRLGTRGKLLLSAVLLVCSLAPAAEAYWGGLFEDNVAQSLQRFNLLYKWPPCQLLNFFFGASVGQLARDKAVLAWRGWPWLVDAAAVALVLYLLLSPFLLPISAGCSDRPALQLRCGHNVFLLSGCNFIFGTMLLGGCALNAGRSRLVRIASTSALSDVGQYSFNIYLLQALVARLFLVLQNFSSGACTGLVDCAEMIQMYNAGPVGSFDSLWWSLLLRLEPPGRTAASCHAACAHASPLLLLPLCGSRVRHLARRALPQLLHLSGKAMDAVAPSEDGAGACYQPGTDARACLSSKERGRLHRGSPALRCRVSVPSYTCYG